MNDTYLGHQNGWDPAKSDMTSDLGKLTSAQLCLGMLVGSLGSTDWLVLDQALAPEEQIRKG